MPQGAQTVFRSTQGDNKAFDVKVGLHRGSRLRGQPARLAVRGSVPADDIRSR